MQWQEEKRDNRFLFGSFFSLQMVFDRYPSGETNVGLLYGILSTSKRETFPLVLDKQKRNVEWAYENFGILEQSQK